MSNKVDAAAINSPTTGEEVLNKAQLLPMPQSDVSKPDKRVGTRRPTVGKAGLSVKKTLPLLMP